MKLPRDKYLTSAEFERLLKAIEARHHKHRDRDLAMFSVCGGCALRVSELAALTVADVARAVEDPAVISVWTRKRRRKQKDDQRIPPFAVEALVAFLAARVNVPDLYHRVTPVGAEDEKLFPLSKRGIEALFKRYAKRAGLSPVYSIHALRHYRGMRVYAETKDVTKVKEFLRHSSIRSTEIYVTATDMDLVGKLGI